MQCSSKHKCLICIIQPDTCRCSSRYNVLSARYACVQPNINYYHKMYHTIVPVPGTHERPHGTPDDPRDSHDWPHGTSYYHRDPGTISWCQRQYQTSMSGLMVPVTITETQGRHHGTSDDPRDTEAASWYQ